MAVPGHMAADSDLSQDHHLASLVYVAAREGKLKTIKSLLGPRSQLEIARVVATKLRTGTTSLLIAARNGHLDVVQYLIEVCSADLEQAGSVVFDGETIEGATPLWCAAAAGHIDVVSCLIDKGASVNRTTLTNSTPLRAACFDGHFDIVKLLVGKEADIEIANRHGHTCLMIACYKGHLNIVKYLLGLSAEVNRKSIKGNTALHDCAESGYLQIFKLMLEHGATMEQDTFGITPLSAAALTGHVDIVEYLILSKRISNQEKIDSLHLLGATFVDKKRDLMGGLKFWRRALEMKAVSESSQWPESECFTVSDKQRLITQTSTRNLAYDNAEEVTSPEALDDLISDPDEMRTQALIVRERILGPDHPDTTYFIRYRGAVYADMGNFDRCVALWMYALELQQNHLDPLNTMTQSSLYSFAELFSFMISEQQEREQAAAAERRNAEVAQAPQMVVMPVGFEGEYDPQARNVAPPSIRVKDLISIFERAAVELRNGMQASKKESASSCVFEKDAPQFNRILHIIMHFLILMTNIQKYFSPEDDLRMKKILYQLVKLRPLGPNGYTLLHIACSKDNQQGMGKLSAGLLPSLEVAKLLIEVGADVSSTDADGDTPLHSATRIKPLKTELIRFLLQSGAHWDQKNKKGEIPYECYPLWHNRTSLVRDAFSAMQIQKMSLQCLSAQVIVKHAIPYKGGLLPRKLEAFVDIH